MPRRPFLWYHTILNSSRIVSREKVVGVLLEYVGCGRGLSTVACDKTQSAKIKPLQLTCPSEQSYHRYLLYQYNAIVPFIVRYNLNRWSTTRRLQYISWILTIRNRNIPVIALHPAPSLTLNRNLLVFPTWRQTRNKRNEEIVAAGP